MKTPLATLKFISLSFLLPGLAGLIVSAMISTYYLDTLPQQPSAHESRVFARNIHGTLIYQTQEEDTRLTLIEDTSVGVFLVGLSLGLVYLEKWGSVRARDAAPDDEFSEDYS